MGSVISSLLVLVFSWFTRKLFQTSSTDFKMKNIFEFMFLCVWVALTWRFISCYAHICNYHKLIILVQLFIFIYMYFYAADVLSISSQKLSISYNTWSECISNNYFFSASKFKRILSQMFTSKFIKIFNIEFFNFVSAYTYVLYFSFQPICPVLFNKRPLHCFNSRLV